MDKTFIEKLQSGIQEIFPKSAVSVRFSKGLSQSITIYFTLGKGNLEYSNAIAQNDAMHTIIHIWNVGENGEPTENMKVESDSAKSITIKSTDRRFVYERLKTGWRNFSGNEQQVIKKITDFYKKTKALLIENKGKLDDYAKNLVEQKYISENKMAKGGIINNLKNNMKNNMKNFWDSYANDGALITAGSYHAESDSFVAGGRITTNEDVLDSFLTNLQREVKKGNLSTHFNQYDNELLLRNYGTLIATRKGDKVEISSKKFSQTTSIIQNKLEKMAKERNFNVEKVEVFEKGGKATGKSMVAEGMYRDADNYKTMVTFNIPSKVKVKEGDDVNVKKFGVSEDEWRDYISNTMRGDGWDDSRDSYEVEITSVREMQDDDMPINSYGKGGKAGKAGKKKSATKKKPAPKKEDLEWNEIALNELREHEGDDSIEETRGIDNGGFEAESGNSQWIVFENVDEAESHAIERVTEDLENEPELFTESWLLDHIDNDKAEKWFRSAYDEMNRSYAEDIMSESSKGYANRLAEEMYERDIITEEEAQDEEFNFEDRIDNFVEKMTDDQIEEGNGGYDHYKFNFGDEQAKKIIKDNNLIDIDDAAKSAVDTDGIAHFIAPYDFEQIDLPSGAVAYRTN